MRNTGLEFKIALWYPQQHGTIDLDFRQEGFLSTPEAICPSMVLSLLTSDRHVQNFQSFLPLPQENPKPIFKALCSNSPKMQTKVYCLYRWSLEIVLQTWCLVIAQTSSSSFQMFLVWWSYL